MIPDQTIADLKARADLAGIVGRHVQLRKRGRDLWGRCPFHQDRTPSFKVDPARRRYHCFGCGAGGDALDFLAAVEGLGTNEAVRRLRDLVGAPLSFRPGPRAPSAPPRAAEPDPQAERNRELARAIWRETSDLCACAGDSLPLRYLRERRGITRWDSDRLRWHVACPWGDGTAGSIVAPVDDAATGLVVGVWRIRPALEGPVGRRGLGPTKSNACRLFQAPGRELAIAEGVEDALAYHELSGIPCWAALSAGNMAALALPSRFREVHVVADADEAGRKGAAELVRRLRGEGRRALLVEPVEAKDPNDVLLAGRDAA